MKAGMLQQIAVGAYDSVNVAAGWLGREKGWNAG